jgi:hypothetical protein
MAEAHQRWVNEVMGAFSDEKSEAMIGLLDTLREGARTRPRERSR